MMTHESVGEIQIWSMNLHKWNMDFYQSFMITEHSYPLTYFQNSRIMGLLPDTKNCGLRMCRKCRESFPRHWLQRKPLVSDPDMHHGTCVTHVPWWMSGSPTRRCEENVPGIPGACTAHNFTYLERGPWRFMIPVMIHDVMYETNYEDLWLNYEIPQSTQQEYIRLQVQLQIIIIISSNKSFVRISNLLNYLHL